MYFGRLNLHGLQAFMAKQARDERQHARKLIQHVADRGGQVELLTIPAPRANFESPLDAAKFVRDLERATTESIYRLYELARKESDYALEVRLHWFITEQVEEEKWSGELMELLERMQEHPEQLFTLDHAWGRRVRAR
jgi:ferritin